MCLILSIEIKIEYELLYDTPRFAFYIFFSATYPVEKIAVKLHICNI